MLTKDCKFANTNIDHLQVQISVGNNMIKEILYLCSLWRPWKLCLCMKLTWFELRFSRRRDRLFRNADDGSFT